MNWLGKKVQTYIDARDTVISLGCGVLQEIDGLKCKHLTGVDIYENYVSLLKRKGIDAFCGDITKINFEENSYDIVLALDVLEHLPKQDALFLLDKMIVWANKKVIIYTPSRFFNNVNEWFDGRNSGFVYKYINENPKSPYYNTGENNFQQHLCLIDKQDFINRNYAVDEIVISDKERSWFAVYNKS